MENEPIPIESSVVPLKDNPVQLMRQATDVAGVCKEIVLKTACNIQGKKYIKCEGWMAIATAHGCLASSRDVEKIAGGYRAVGEIRRISDGVVLSTAEGFVGLDEKKWSTSPEYACRAMAQTRAISRACRAAFAHVVVMMDAGLSTTPAEEVPDEGFTQPAPRQASGGSQSSAPPSKPALAPQPASRPAATTAQVATPTPPAEADKDQRFRFLASLSSNREVVTAYLVQKGWLTQGQNLEDLPNKYVPTMKSQYDSFVAELQAYMDTPADQRNVPEWRTYKLPWGRHMGEEMAQVDKKWLFGMFMNFTVEYEYDGKPKSEAKIAEDEKLRKMLDAAGEHYDWKRQ